MIDHFKNASSRSYRQLHLLNLDLSGSPCPAQSLGQRKHCAAFFLMILLFHAQTAITILVGFEPIADEWSRTVALRVKTLTTT